MLEYRSAIALNNIGCALLQKHCYEQGHRCLRDAMGLMRYQHDDQVGKLQRARSYLVNPRPSSVSLVLQTVSSSDGIGLGPSSRIICSQANSLVRIEASEQEDMDSELLCCIMLYNWGVSFLCLANAATLESRSKLLASAVRVVKLSIDILALCHDEKMHSLCIYSMAILQLKALCEALKACGQTEDASECDIRLTELIAEVVRLDAFHTDCFQPAAPAA